MAADILEQIDATVEGRCAGPDCSAQLTDQSSSAYFCSSTCQEIWQRRQVGRPSPGSAPVRGSGYVPPDQARWRPGLVAEAAALDPDLDPNLELIVEQPHRDGMTTRWYRYPATGRQHLRLDDGHRFVGADIPEDADALAQAELLGRLERELTDPRRLDLEPGRSEPAPIMRVGDRVYDERDRPALIAWLCANGLVPEEVPAGQTVSIDGDMLILDCFTRDSEGNLLAQPVSVPLRQPPPEPRSDLLRRMGEAFDRVLRVTARATEAFRRMGEAIASSAAAFRSLPSVTQEAIRAESDRAALRAICTDEAMYEQALDAARERGWSVRQMFEAVTAGRYTEQGWAEPDRLAQATGAAWVQVLAAYRDLDAGGPPAPELVELSPDVLEQMRSGLAVRHVRRSRRSHSTREPEFRSPIHLGSS